MNQLSQDGPYRNEGSLCAELIIGAERELSAFFSGKLASDRACSHSKSLHSANRE